MSEQQTETIYERIRRAARERDERENERENEARDNPPPSSNSNLLTPSELALMKRLRAEQPQDRRAGERSDSSRRTSGDVVTERSDELLFQTAQSAQYKKRRNDACQRVRSASLIIHSWRKLLSETKRE